MYAVRRSAPIILARNANGERVFAEHLTLLTKNVIDRMMVSPQALGQESFAMSKPIVIEVAGRAVAVAAPVGDQGGGTAYGQSARRTSGTTGGLSGAL
mgnify:CR=1 FL=1